MQCFVRQLPVFVVSACGAVVGSVSLGEFYPAAGSSVTCDLSGASYDYHSLILNGQVSHRSNISRLIVLRSAVVLMNYML